MQLVSVEVCDNELYPKGLIMGAPLIYKCIKTFTMDDGTTVAFIAGKMYQTPTTVVIGPPDPNVNFVLINEQNEPHWFDDSSWRELFEFVSGPSRIRMPIGFECPECGNSISYEESDFGESIFCNRCESGEYTTMDPVYPNYED